MQADALHRWWMVVFVLSGCAGLIYESLWTHYLKLFLGHAAQAQALVLMVFMGGMALGARLVSRHSQTWRQPLLIYALVEGAIGVMGLLFHPLYLLVTGFHHDLLAPALGYGPAAEVARWGWAVLLLLPQSMLLGMTFPLMAAGMIRQTPDHSGSLLAMLYFSNSVGAAAGVLVNGFLLVPMVGLPGAGLSAGLLNLLVGLLVWLPASRQPAFSPRVGQRILLGHTLSWRWILPLAALITGLASFLYEIAWIRMLNLVLGASTHGFELMLSAFLLGLALGGLWIRRRIDQLLQPLAFLGWVQVGMGLLAMATLPLYHHTFDWMGTLMAAFTPSEAGLTGFLVASHGLVMVMMLPATVCAGMTLPLLTKILVDKGGGEQAIGQIYAANTLGAILGVLLAMTMLLPMAGVKQVVAVGAGLDVGLGLYLLALPGRHRIRVMEWGMALASVALLAAIWHVTDWDPHRLASGVFRTGKARWHEDARFLLHQDGRSATISLVVTPDGTRAVMTNGKTDASVAPPDQPAAVDEASMISLAALPLALHPEAQSAAIIGMGSGLTGHTLLTTPRLQSLDLIEIEPVMIEAARLGFGERFPNLFQDHRVRMHIDDAKSFLTTTGNRYDILISNPSNPWVSGVASLFSREFYQRVADHLQDNGLLVQWIQLYETDMRVVASILKALSPHFQDWAIFVAAEADLILVARKGGTIGPLQAAGWEAPGLRPLLQRIEIRDIGDLARRRLGDKALLDKMFQTLPGPVNSDYFPFVDLNGFRNLFLKSHAREWVDLLTLPLPLLDLLTHAPRHGETPSPIGHRLFPADRHVREALAMRNEDWAQLPLPVASDLRQATLSPPHCLREEHRPVWREALHNTANRMMAFLAPEELEPFWSRLVPEACLASLAREDRQWLTLYQAVGQRNSQAMAEGTATLLAANPSPDQQAWLVLAGLLAAVASHDPSAFDHLAKTYLLPALQRGEPPSLAVALLLSRRP